MKCSLMVLLICLLAGEIGYSFRVGSHFRRNTCLLQMTLEPVEGSGTAVKMGEDAAVTAVVDNASSSVQPPAALDTRTQTVEAFVAMWRNSLKGEASDAASAPAPLSKSAEWEGNPIANNIADVRSGWKEFSEFFEEPSVVVFDRQDTSQTTSTLTFQLSFWYPMPWRPRIIIPGQITLTFTDDLSSISAVKEQWDVTVVDIMTKQLPPRWWDLWHVFSSPSPERPPSWNRASVGKVEFQELPERIALEVAWSNLAQYPGPPLTVVPTMALFGKLKTSKPRRDPYYAILPVEVQSTSFITTEGKAVKQSSWVLTVPSNLQEQVYEHAKAGRVFTLPEVDMMEGGQGDKEESTDKDDMSVNDDVDYMVRMENMSVMKSATGGKLRGNFETNNEVVRAFRENQRQEYRYIIQPKRRIASTRIKGEVTSAKISEALKMVKGAIKDGGADRAFGEKCTIKKVQCWGQLAEAEGVTGNGSDAINLQLWHTKGCFNAKAELAMSVYEMQYGGQETSIFIELD